MATAAWTADWPRCLLLLELTVHYVRSGRTHGCAKLRQRLQDWQSRMEDAPPPVHLLLSELCYVSWLLSRGDLATARHHLAAAQQKAAKIGLSLRWWHREEIRRHASSVRRKSRQLRRRTRETRERSEFLLAQTAILLGRRPAVAEVEPELVLT